MLFVGRFVCHFALIMPTQRFALFSIFHFSFAYAHIPDRLNSLCAILKRNQTPPQSLEDAALIKFRFQILAKIQV